MVPSPSRRPSLETVRPPEPMRPLPAQHAGVSLLATKVRRRRYRTGPGLPRHSGR